MKPDRRERGSALLIVFLFAAIIAIMLYKELPVAAFEARRQKEELLIDRGEEYKHAIKLFVRKVGTFPASIDALESTNRMRFLRHKFDDPITGKADWRLIHAGPNGIITDSKIAANNGVPGGPTAAGGNGSNSTNSTSGFGNSSPSFVASSGFGSSSGFGGGSSFGNNNSGSPGATNTSGNPGFGGGFSSGFGTSSGAGAVVPAVPQRAPAVSAGAPPTGSAELAAAGSPGSPNDPTQPADPNAPVSPVNVAARAPASTDQQAQLRALLENQNPSAGPAGSGQPVTVPVNPTANSTGNNSFSASSMGTTGKLLSGGLAGVASIAVGTTIKVVNDQTDFSLWEFYYDMAKDAANARAGALTGGTGLSGNTPAQSSSTNSGFSLGTTSFGASSTNSTSSAPASGTTPIPAVPLPQQ